MNPEMRILNYDDIEDCKEVIETRQKKIMLSSSGLNPNFINYHFDTRPTFEKNLCFGLYEENKLDCFIYLNIWQELPTYSPIIYSRAKPNRKKLDNGHDVNLTTLRDYQLAYTEKLGLFYFYAVTNATPNWKPIHENKYTRFSQYEAEIMEYIPAGSLSRYILFRNNLIGRKMDVPMNIRLHTLPKSLRP